ncbi:MAG: hypothetical protein KF852_02510 [Saprospiraceae bacterium]|nr:hypothetical protein [Saprospiraceae bacterium]
MFASCEVRWFFPQPPELLRAWFGRRGRSFQADGSPLRCDFYLRPAPRRTDLSIKLREGSIEIKERTRNYGIRQFGAHISGRMEQWRKWSFRLAATREGGTEEVLHITRQYGDSGEWIPVWKERLLLLLEIQEEGRVVLSDAPPFALKEGCGIELTRVQIPGEIWYTFGTEAFSAAGRTRHNLLLAMDTLIAEMPDLHLSVQESMSYPTFLGRY